VIRPTNMDEDILVVPRHLLLPNSVHGFTVSGVQEYRSRVLTYGEFRLRSEMEHDPSMKQIIPYLIVRYDSKVFAFQRSAEGGETRLHGKFSVGVGGHINRADVEGAVDVVDAGLRRELLEELVIRGAWKPRLVGAINDDSIPVGRVHFGLVHVIDLESPAVEVREVQSLSGGLVDRAQLLQLRDRMETWSQFIFAAADPLAL